MLEYLRYSSKCVGISEDEDQDEESESEAKLEECFDRAIRFLGSSAAKSVNLEQHVRLKMYGLFKQVSEGNYKSVKPKCPSMFDAVARAKWSVRAGPCLAQRGACLQHGSGMEGRDGERHPHVPGAVRHE